MDATSDDDLTRAPGSTGISTPSGTRSPSSGAFAPGEIVAGRYRLVALLGRGGMGEVYRADDLTLDQPVALKFLPEGVAADAARLAQFHGELRVARQVSHKNVCRLYDLGEAAGRRFLTMEYVDGEDLASLLRRIGRLPHDKALEIARQLCAAVAAAHERGVLHRDLKPANVMIDGDGDVRVTDFGLATAAGDTGAVLAGTPQYMAPEQLAGQPASTKTDIYALGLILFELFTGRRAFEAKTLGDLRHLHDSGTVPTPSSIVRDLDPAVERVILRCIAQDPARRPASALSVAAALPGSDPLAAALEAGETPSPDMLVAAGETEAMPLGRAVALAACLAAALVVYAVVSPRANLAALVPLDLPPAALADRARLVAGALGYEDTPQDEVYAFSQRDDLLEWIARSSRDLDRWRTLSSGSPPALVLWYRTSPAPLLPIRWTTSVALVWPTDPPPSVPGMRTVLVDTRGRLVEFHAVPPHRDPDRAPPPAPRWDGLFQAAGLELPAFSLVTPEWTPHEYADTRAAWEGPLPERPDAKVRVEAAAYRGRPVSFLLVGPWSQPAKGGTSAEGQLASWLGTLSLVFWLSAFVASALMARFHLRANRADRRSAARLAVGFMVLFMGGWLVGSHHVADLNGEAVALFRALGAAAFAGGVLWMLYLSLEPYGRRFWPDGLLGWARLLAGHFRDPRVGREVLIGCALGGGLLMLDMLHQLAPRLIGAPAPQPGLGGGMGSLLGGGGLLLEWFQQGYNSVESSLLIVLVFVGLRLLVRRSWIAAAIGIVVVAAISSSSLSHGGLVWLDALFAVAAIGLITLAIFRFGLLVTIVALLADNLPSDVPFTGRFFHWSATPGNLTILVVVALACFGIYAARGGEVFPAVAADKARGA